MTTPNDVLHLLRLRLWEETPFLVEDIWVPLPLFGPLAEVDLAEVGPRTGGDDQIVVVDLAVREDDGPPRSVD